MKRSIHSKTLYVIRKNWLLYRWRQKGCATDERLQCMAEHRSRHKDSHEGRLRTTVIVLRSLSWMSSLWRMEQTRSIQQLAGVAHRWVFRLVRTLHSLIFFLISHGKVMRAKEDFRSRMIETGRRKAWTTVLTRKPGTVYAISVSC